MPRWHRPLVAVTLMLLLVGCSDGFASSAGQTATPATTTPAPGLLGIVTQVSSTVTVALKTSATTPMVRRVVPNQVLRAEETVHIPQGASVALICSTDFFVSLTGEATWPLTEEGCARGRGLPTGSYRGAVLPIGRVIDHHYSQVLEAATRANLAEIGIRPIVVEPRNTRILDGRPTVRWVPVAGASAYRITWIGPSSAVHTIQASDVACTHDSTIGLQRCTLPFPTEQAALIPGSTYFLRVASRTEGTLAWSEPEERVHVEVATSAHVDDVRQRIATLDALPLDAGTRTMLVAGYSKQHGLHSDAERLYRQLYAAQAQPEIAVALGEIYRAIAFDRAALAAYTDALQRLGPTGDAAIRAAAETGLGRIYLANAQYAEAARHFEHAEQIYVDLGWSTEREVAAAGVAAARQPRER